MFTAASCEVTTAPIDFALSTQQVLFRESRALWTGRVSAHWLASLGRAGNSDDAGGAGMSNDEGDGSRGLGSGWLSPVAKQEEVTLQPSTMTREPSATTDSARGGCALFPVPASHVASSR